MTFNCNKNKVFSNIVNTNHNQVINEKKSKQKSILDYFNRSANNETIKTNSNHFKRNNSSDNLFKNKIIRGEDNDISIVDEKIVIESNVKSKSNKNKTHEKQTSSDVSKQTVCHPIEESFETEDDFIDTNEFLEIDFYINEELNHSSNDNSLEEMESNESNHIKGSYIYDNFRQMIDSVLKDEQYLNLFDANDWKIIESFTSLSGSAQMLFMRLFLRKRDWIRKSTIKYPQIDNNLMPMLSELVNNGFLLNATHLDDLLESLNILDANEIKKVCRSLNGFNMNGLNTKKNIISALIKYLNTCQPVIKSNDDSNSINQVVLKQVKKTLKDVCFKVNEILCDVFERMFFLYYPPEINDEDYNKQLNFEFFKILRVNTGQELYPKYSINRNAVIYQTRDDLVNYAIAFKLENEIFSAIERKSFDEVINNLMNRSKILYRNSIEGKIENRDSCLPSFLRRYTAGHSYIRCLSYCVNVLEQKKNYSEAVLILKDVLLSQTVYCQDCRGRWFERLALNLEKHLKDPKSALTVVEDGLRDEFVRTGHRYALYLRRKNIQKSLKMPLSLITEFESIKYPETVIFAEIVKYSISDRKHIFKTTDSNGDVTVMPVEDIVIKHYINNGFTHGLHTEGLVYHALFALLFWDIIYMSDNNNVLDSFRFNYQRLPLDFNSDEFFIRRKTQIISLLETLKSLDETEINNILENSWNSKKGIVSLLNWDNIELNQIKQITTCLGSRVITGICERLIKDFRHSRSGFPDLIVWNNINKTIKVIEVKGPNDRPSTKQQLWLSYLKSLGLDVEICHVKVKKSF